MAELVGLAASLTTLLQVAGQIAQLSYAYVSDVRNAPKVQKRYLQEVSAFMDVLFQAERAIIDSEATGCVPSRPASLTDTVIQECHMQLQSLQSELEKRTRRLLWPFQSKELEKSIGILSRFRSIFADFVSATSLIATTATYKKLESLSIQQDKHQLLTWLETERQPLRARPSPCLGTGQWFLEHSKYVAWRNDPSTVLWCCGPPGVGKSFLASLAISDLQGKGNKRPFVLSFFADFSARERHTTLAIFQSLLRQIIEQGDSDVIATVKDAFTDDPSRLRELDGICTIIGDVCARKETYLVLDAPDELKKPDELLVRLKSINTSGCKLMIMSREMLEMKRRFDFATRLDIKTGVEDISNYIRDRFESSEFADELADAADLVEKIVSKSEKTFLLAKLIMDQMLEHTTIRKMRKSLEAVPKSIQEAYETNLRRIDSQPGSKASLARRLLLWITHAKRRLNTGEILDAFAVEEGLDEIDPENVHTVERLLAPCVGLVVVDPVDQTVGLIHNSAYEFFRDHCGKHPESDMDVARTSLSYLSLRTFQFGSCKTASALEERFHRMRFLHYSVHHLGAHMLDGTVDAELMRLLIKFLRSEQLRASAFQALQFRLSLSGDLAEEFIQSIPTGVSALHLTACWNLKDATTALLELGESLTALDSQNWTPLHYACSKGHWEVAEVLVRAGAPLDVQDSQGWTPMFWASFTGSALIVQLLLDSGADHLVQSTLGWTALHWAVSRGEKDVVNLLLQHHRDHMKQPPTPKKLVASLSYAEAIEYANKSPQEDTTSPMEIAAESHQRGVFDALTDQYRDSVRVDDNTFNKIWADQKFLNPVSNPWRTLTKGECFREHEVKDMFRLLSEDRSGWHLTYKRPDNLPENTIWKSKLLISAINDGKLTAARLLIESEADVNFNCNTTPLHAATFQEDPSFCEMLLQKGVDTSAVDERGYRALHHAVMNSFLATVTLLLDVGADPNARVDSPSPQWRSSERPYSTLKVDTDRLGYHFGVLSKTPLILACGPILLQSAPEGMTQRTKQIMDALLSKGADPNIPDDEGLTPLHYAATLPDPYIISTLLAGGADPDIVDNGGRSALHLLARFARLDQPSGVLRDAIDQILTASPQKDKAILVNQQASPARSLSSPGPENFITATSDTRSTDDVLELQSTDTVKLPSFGFWDEQDRDATPTTSALINGRWLVFDILREKGGVVPSTLRLDSILQDAIRELHLVKVSKLLSLGAKPEPSAIRDLTAAITGRQWGSRERRVRRTSSSSYPTKIHDWNSTVSVDDRDMASFDAIMHYLLTGGDLDIDWQEPGSGVAAIHLSARTTGAEGVMQILLKQGADPTVELRSGIDASILAALYQNTAHLRCLLKHLVLRNHPNHWAARLPKIQDNKDDYELLCGALQKHGVLERRYHSGGTLLHLAAGQDHFPLVKALLSCGASKYATDKKGFVPLHYAALTETKQAMEALWLPTTADGNLIELDLPLHVHFKSDFEISYLEKQGSRTTLLHSAVQANKPQMVADLLDHGATIDVQCDHSGTPLYLAAKLGHHDLVSSLISRGAKVDLNNKHGWCPIHIAALNGHKEIVETLIASAADLHATTRHWGESNPYPSGVYVGNDWKGQALHLAALQGHVGVVQLLLQHDVDVNASTGVYGSRNWEEGEITGLSCGPTALHNALSTGYLDGRTGDCLDQNRLLIARMLIEAGADVEGVGDYLSVKHVLRFEGFEDVWDAVRVGITENGKPVSPPSTSPISR